MRGLSAQYATFRRQCGTPRGLPCAGALNFAGAGIIFKKVPS